MKCVVTVLSLVAALAAAPIAAGAQEKPKDFPRKPIELVVVYAAGGGMDVTARTLAKEAEAILGHKFRVANRVGGGGRVGHAFLAKEAKPDGYTIGVLSMGAVFNHMLEANARFAKEDFDPINYIAFEPYLYMTRGPSFDEIIATARKRGPNKLRVGVVSGSTSSLILALIEEQFAVRFARVPFQGGKPRLLGLINGTIDFAPVFYTEAEQYYKTGDAKLVAVTDTKHHPNLPEIRPIAEYGLKVPAATFGATRFITLPPGVPANVRAYLEASFVKVLKAEQTRTAFRKIGVAVQPMGAAETKRVYDEVYGTTRELTAKAAGAAK